MAADPNLEVEDNLPDFDDEAPTLTEVEPLPKSAKSEQKKS